MRACLLVCSWLFPGAVGVPGDGMSSRPHCPLELEGPLPTQPERAGLGRREGGGLRVDGRRQRLSCGGGPEESRVRQEGVGLSWPSCSLRCSLRGQCGTDSPGDGGWGWRGGEGTPLLSQQKVQFPGRCSGQDSARSLWERFPANSFLDGEYFLLFICMYCCLKAFIQCLY